jgi:hypothetical protein
MVEEEPKSLKEIPISKVLPYVSSFIICLGIIRLIYFFSAFGISIVTYLDFSEILTSFLDMFLILCFVFAVFIFQTFFMFGKTEMENSYKLKQVIITEPKLIRRFKLYIKYSREVYYSAQFVFITLTFYFLLFKESDDSILTLIKWASSIVIAFLFILITGEVDRRLYLFNYTNLQRQVVQVLFNIVLIIIVTATLTQNEINSIKKDKSTYGTLVVLDNDQVINSDSINYYIGKTRNYVFVHHENLNTTDVIPMSRVKQITIAQRKPALHFPAQSLQ